MLAVEDLVSGYGGSDILHGITLETRSNFTAIIGPNGSGKSTLLKTVFGYLNVKRGSVRFNGAEITAMKPFQILRHGLAYVPQGRSVFPDISVEENLKMGGWILDDKNKLNEQINRVYDYFPKLRERKSQLAGTMSGGEQRMLEVGRAFLLEPKMIMLDEPSLGLAPGIISDLFGKLQTIKEEGTKIIMVEQNVRKVMSVCDYVYVLDLGKIAYQGTPEEVTKSELLTKLYLGVSV